VIYFAQLLRNWYQRLPRTDMGDIAWARYIFLLLKKITLWFLGLSLAGTIVFAFVPVPLTPLMIMRTWEQMWDGDRDVRLYKNWESLDNMSTEMQLAVVCSEDQDFLEHEGFDFKAIKNAYKYNKTHKKKRGASTISQQTAKNMFLWPSRSWLRKGFEIYFTFLIETIWSKERIMEVYLNIIEFGDGIYGAEAASKHYFNKSAKNLNRSEAALLSAILPSPLKYSVSNPQQNVRERQYWVMRQMRAWGGEIDYEDPNTPKK
jgi:monofunctional glycosyltransferase